MRLGKIINYNIIEKFRYDEYTDVEIGGKVLSLKLFEDAFSKRINEIDIAPMHGFGLAFHAGAIALMKHGLDTGNEVFLVSAMVVESVNAMAALFVIDSDEDGLFLWELFAICHSKLSAFRHRSTIKALREVAEWYHKGADHIYEIKKLDWKVKEILPPCVKIANASKEKLEELQALENQRMKHLKETKGCLMEAKQRIEGLRKTVKGRGRFRDIVDSLDNNLEKNLKIISSVIIPDVIENENVSEKAL